MDCKNALKRCLGNGLNPVKVCFLSNNCVVLADIRAIFGNIRERWINQIKT